MQTRAPRIMLTSESAARRLRGVRMLVDLDLPLGFHALPVPEKMRIVEREMNNALAVADASLDTNTA